MPKAPDLLVALGSLAIGVAGLLGVFALSLGMNARVSKAVTEPVAVIATAAMEPAPHRAGPTRPERAAPVRKARAQAPAASPLLAANLGGLDFGLGSAA